MVPAHMTTRSVGTPRRRRRAHAVEASPRVRTRDDRGADVGGDAQPLEAGPATCEASHAELTLHEPVGDVHDADREPRWASPVATSSPSTPAAEHDGPAAALGGRDDARGVVDVLEHEHPVDQALVVATPGSAGRARPNRWRARGRRSRGRRRSSTTTVRSRSIRAPDAGRAPRRAGATERRARARCGLLDPATTLGQQHPVVGRERLLPEDGHVGPRVGRRRSSSTNRAPTMPLPTTTTRLMRGPPRGDGPRRAARRTP